jgi:uncharacterized membrane-anchored protein
VTHHVLRATLVAAVFTSIAPAQQPRDAGPKSAAKWTKGPCTGRLGNSATIQVPAGYEFADATNAQIFLQELGNPRSPRTLGAIKPVDRNDEWLIEFSFNAMGYVKDDDKEQIDAAAILDSIREGNDEANKERRRMGVSELTVVGWDQPPFYDPQTNRLTWAVRGRAEDGDVINYNSRLLGREGVMSANLICSPEDLASAKGKYQSLLNGYKFNPGKTYAEFRPGDKVAEYGLAALIAGGGVAVAAKTGLLGKLIKPIIAGVVVVFGAISAFFKKLFGRKSSAGETSGPDNSPARDND